MVASGVQRVGGHINQHFGAVALVLVIGGLVAAAHVLVSAQLRALVRDLRKAIEDDQLRMEYQTARPATHGTRSSRRGTTALGPPITRTRTTRRLRRRHRW